MELTHDALLTIVKTALTEDIGRGDITSLGCLEPNPVRGQIVAKSEGVLSGSQPALLVFELVDSANVVTFLKADGERFARGEAIAVFEGFNQTLLVAERVALNFLGHLSGIASLTRQYVDAIRSWPNCRILDTRKTTPGLRVLEKLAVAHGGGTNHRFGLYDMILIKDNHIASAGSIKSAIELAREFLASRDFRLQFDTDAAKILVEVEISSEAELREAIACHVDRLLLDNQSVESLRQLVPIARGLDPSVKLEASGNVSLASVADIAATGVDFISVGAITHSAPVSDFSMKVVHPA